MSRTGVPPAFNKLIVAALKEVEVSPSAYLGELAFLWDHELSKHFTKVRSRKTGEPTMSLEIRCFALVHMSNAAIQGLVVDAWNTVRFDSNESHLFVTTENVVSFYFMARYLRTTGRCLATGRVTITTPPS